MNKGQLVDALESRLGSKKAAAEALEAVVDVITVTVAKGEKVAITGFGTFEKAARAARTGRNPRTGQAVRIKKTSVPRFRAGTAFKEVTSDTKALQAFTAAAAGRAAAATTTRRVLRRERAAPRRRPPPGEEGRTGQEGRSQEGCSGQEGGTGQEGSSGQEGRTGQEGRRRRRP